MPNLDDFFIFMMSEGDSEGGGGDGCLRPILIAVVVIGFLSLLSQCCG